MAVTRTRLLVAQEGSNEILLCTHFQSNQVQQVLVAIPTDDVSSIHSMVLGGRDHNKLVVSSHDGKRILVYLTPTEESGSAVTEVVAEAHTAEVTGSCPGIGRAEVVTCSSDGRLCIWDCVSHTCTDKRTFTAELSAVTSFPKLRLMVVGSKAGVIRTVYGGSGLPVVCRSRVSHQPITHIVSTMDAGVGVLTFISGMTVFLTRVESTGLLSGLKTLDTVGVPTALAFAHSLRGLKLLISVAACELVCLDVEDSLMLKGPSIPERRMRISAPVTAMCCVGPASQNSIGRICALFLDHMLRCGDLPADASAWSTVKGRGMRLQDMSEIDGSIVGAQLTAVSNDTGNVVVVASRSGSMWSANMASKGNRGCVHVGDAADCGVSTISSNDLGTMLVVGCEDGSVVFCGVGARGKSADTEDVYQAMSDQAAMKVDKDMADDDDEAVNHTQRPVEALPAAMSSHAMQTSVEQNTIMFKLSSLKEKLHVLLQRNDKEHSSDQVARNDLTIHTDLASRLRQTGKVRVEHLRSTLMRNAVCTEIVGWRIQTECQAGIQVQQQTLQGIRVPAVIHSYPQRTSSTKADETTHIRFLQSVEAREWSSTGRSGMAAAFLSQLAPDEPNTQHNTEDDTVPSTTDLLAGSCCLYSEWDLTTVKRRTIAMRVLEAQVLQHQSAFNTQLEKVAKQRHDAEDTLHEQNQRLAEAVSELLSMGFHPSPDECKAIQVPEAHGSLDILDSGSQDTIQASAIKPGTDASQSAKQSTSNYERALKQMMNGELKSKASSNVVWVLEKPDWMLQPASEWTDQQKELAQNFNAEQKRLDDQRESRKQLLEGEIRSTRSAAEELCTKIDEEIVRLLSRKRRMDQFLGELELQAITACKGADSLACLGPSERHKWLLQGSAMQMREQTLRSVVHFVREKIADLQYAMDQQINADKQLERSLKTVLQEAEDLTPELNTVARTWKVLKRADEQSQNCPDPFPSQASKHDYLPIALDEPQASMPCNCDAGLWQKLLRWYSSKAQSNNFLVQMQAEMLELKSALDSVNSDSDRVSRHSKECIDKSHSIQQSAKKNMQDAYIPLHLKNRIVEIDTVSMQDDVRADARMLHVEHVSNLNQVVRERGTACVNILKEIRDFKVGIYKLLYECKRLDMGGEDASTRVRDLQLLRVTSDLNQLFANPGRATKKSSIEMQQMEAQMQHNHVLHKKSISDRERLSASLAMQMAKKAKMNTQLQEQVMSLADLMDDQVPVMESVMSKRDPDRRAKSLATSRKLQEIMRAQQHEIASMKQELHKLNLRSFPAFSNLYTPVADVDMGESKDEISAVHG